MALSGLGWLTFLSPSLANRLLAYIEVLGIIAEASLMLWLLVKGGERSTMEGAGQRAGGIANAARYPTLIQ
jgi:hypothetical protein